MFSVLYVVIYIHIYMCLYILTHSIKHISYCVTAKNLTVIGVYVKHRDTFKTIYTTSSGIAFRANQLTIILNIV
jgi:hypothetical protein